MRNLFIFINLIICSSSFALNLDFNPPKDWLQPQPKLAKEVWQHPKMKDVHLTYLGYDYPSKFQFHKMSKEEITTYVTNLQSKRSQINKFLGVTAWVVKDYHVEDTGSGQLLKMQGTYLDNSKTMKFQSWVYMNAKDQQEIEIVFTEKSDLSEPQIAEYLKSLKVIK